MKMYAHFQNLWGLQLQKGQLFFRISEAKQPKKSAKIADSSVALQINIDFVHMINMIEQCLV